jgi:hypothetical protein
MFTLLISLTQFILISGCRSLLHRPSGVAEPGGCEHDDQEGDDPARKAHEGGSSQETAVKGQKSRRNIHRGKKDGDLAPPAHFSSLLLQQHFVNRTVSIVYYRKSKRY